MFVNALLIIYCKVNGYLAALATSTTSLIVYMNNPKGSFGLKGSFNVFSASSNSIGVISLKQSYK